MGRSAILRQGNSTAVSLVLVLCGLLLLASSALADVTFAFIDVGQGDAIWLSDGEGFNVLVDGGSRGMGGRVLDAVGNREDLEGFEPPKVGGDMRGAEARARRRQRRGVAGDP